jgi:NAD(P)-dependent dehydrogenase (short-subunit alcohol dehydrogenase family)
MSNDANGTMDGTTSTASTTTGTTDGNLPVVVAVVQDPKETAARVVENGGSGIGVVVPQILPGITHWELETAIRVLEAVAALHPKHQKKKNHNNNNNPSHNKKRKTDDDDETSTNEETHDDNPNLLLDLYQQSKELRPLRKALASCLQVHQTTMFQGKTELDHLTQRQNSRSLKRQKMAENDLQRKYVAATALRRGRMEKLQEKQDEHREEEQAKVLLAASAAGAAAAAAVQLMIPDGPVPTSTNMRSKSSTRGLLENNSGSATHEIDAAQKNDSDPMTTMTTTTAMDEEEEEEGANDGITSATTSTATTNTNTIQLPKLRSCYVCKTRFRELHHFYDQLCPPCANLNWTKRHQQADLTGKVAVVTGSRVKIGYQTCLKLLRAGCSVIATTRFPNAAAHNYQAEPDFVDWHHRLQIYGLDLRDVTGLEAFTRFLKVQLQTTGLDILINNACQTVRRPTAYYLPLTHQEESLWTQANDTHKALLTGCLAFERVRRQLVLDHHQHQEPQENHSQSQPQRRQHSIMQQPIMELEDNPNIATPRGGGGGGEAGMTRLMNTNPDADSTFIHVAPQKDPMEVVSTMVVTSSAVTTKTTTTATTTPFETRGISHSAAMSQMVVLPEDVGINDSILPPGVTDINGQQLDLRTTNSWLLTMEQVSTPEVMECMFINAIAPFVLNSRLKPLMTLHPTTTTTAAPPRRRDDRYVINVSAMEGKFYRYKMANHPHTNMAKAALNMMTRTSAEELAKKDRIFMNSVDTGWINDENPLERAHKTAKTNLFQTPIDEIDAAARILDPIFVGVNGEPDLKDKDYGKFLKDYRETEW